MSAGDWILLSLIGGYCLWLLLRPRRKKCSGDCAGCSGCQKK